MIYEFASFSTQNHQNLANLKMKPKKSPQKNRQIDLFRPELIKIINPDHEMVKLANVVEWGRLDELFGETYCPDNGRPDISTRLMVSEVHVQPQRSRYGCRMGGKPILAALERNEVLRT
jgi:hypothetical protein